MNYIYIAIGGAIGAILRYLVSGWSYALLGTGFPWGTLAVNLIGSFLIGLIWQLFANAAVSPNVRLLILTGGLGAFTTFSTFALESVNLFRDGDIGLGFANVLVSDILGIALVFAGIIAGRLAGSLLHIG
ncbi:MAG: fluoride efflux transporter CrcB [Candidatus Promineifilaceae bacterium]